MAGLWAETSDHDGQQPAKDFFLTYISKFLESVAVLCSVYVKKPFFWKNAFFLAETGIFFEKFIVFKIYS